MENPCQNKQIDFKPPTNDQEFLTKHNLAYTEMYRIQPERLITKQPIEYDASLRNHDIDGAYAIIKKQNPVFHNSSLRTDDIDGAQSKKSIRNIWGEYDYNPLAKKIEKHTFIQPNELNPARNPLFYSSQAMSAQIKNLEPNFVPTDPHSTLENKSANPKWLEQRYPKTKYEPQSQLKEMQIMNPPDYTQANIDYDKIVQPYQKPIKEAQLMQKLQEHSQAPQLKHHDVPEKMKQYQKTQSQMNQFDSQLLKEISQKNQQNDSYQKNYENFYRGYTPNQESQKQYEQTSKILAQKQNEISQKAKNIEQNIFQDPLAYNQNQTKFFGLDNKLDIKQNQERFYEDQNGRGGQSRGMSHSQSVQQIPGQFLNAEKKPWSKFEYNLIGNYPKEKRQLKICGYNPSEVKYYSNYDPMKQSQIRKCEHEIKNNQYVETMPGYQKNKEQFFGVTDNQIVQPKENQLDHNTLKDYHQFEQQQMEKQYEDKQNPYQIQPKVNKGNEIQVKSLRNMTDNNIF